MDKKNLILLIFAIFLIIIGILLFSFPTVSNYVYNENVKEQKEEFIFNIENAENKNILDDLYEELQKVNVELYEKQQQNLVDPFSYEQSTIDLNKYGIRDNIIGYIRIPKIEIELPIILGANVDNMLKGAVHLTQTSYPIGGKNTNSVIAGHRGYGKAKIFRYIDKLYYGDKIYIQNFREELIYEVYDIKIINPDDIKELIIEEDKEIITIITCHPYRVNNKRYVIKAKRILDM